MNQRDQVGGGGGLKQHTAALKKVIKYFLFYGKMGF